MLNKARKKFILWAMTAMAVIVLVLVTAVNLVNWYQNNKRLDAALNEITQYRVNTGQFGTPMDDAVAAHPDDGMEEMQTPPFMPPESSGEKADSKGTQQQDFKGPRGRMSALTQYGSRYFIAIIDSEDQVIRVEQQQDTVNIEDAQALVDSLPDNLTDGGYINAYKYRYMTSFDDKRVICFLDCTTDLNAMNSLLLISVIVGAAGLVLAFLFILKMSSIAVEPVHISIEKQKQFITNAGHELKTPLTSIATNMDILTMDLGKNEWVESTKKQVGKLRRLVGNLVSLSKMEEDETELGFMEFSVSEMAQECVESFESAAIINNKEMTADIAQNLTIQADPGTVQQLMTILCDNAIKYSKGSGNIKVRLYEEGKNICFETSNEWERNVDDEHLDDLFERFYRGDPSRTSDTSASGYGLGLSIAQAIAQKNNGKLTVQSDGSDRIIFRAKFRR